jgi:hypothetical protein
MTFPGAYAPGFMLPSASRTSNDADQFAKSGGKLLKLEFPKTEIQVYGYTAVVYSNYSYELETGGQRLTQAGRVTEVFVLRKGQWVNPGWHMDSGK